VQTPDFFQTHNVQQETNLHNLLSRRKLHAAFIIFSGAAAFAWLFLPMVIRYLPARLRTFFEERTWLIAPDRKLMLYFLPCTLLYIYFDRDYINPATMNAAIESLFGPGSLSHPIFNFLHPDDEEPIELLLGAGLMIFTLMAFWRVRRLPERKARA
jgi:hypothetical protein